MKRPMAVKLFLEKDSAREKISPSEFMAFWKACSDEERQQFADSAAQQLGILLDA